MSAHPDTPRPSTVFAIPEDAHLRLVQLGNDCRLMAQLTKVGGNASIVDARLRPDSMAWCFQQLAKETEAIVSASWFSTEVVNAFEAAQKSRKARPAA